MTTKDAFRVLSATLALLCWTMCGRADCCERCRPETGRRLQHAGHDVYYEVHGQGSRTLVFVHGWTSSLEVWKHQLGAFPEYRQVAIDLPGNGHSSRREEAAYTMELFADAVQAVLAAEKIDKAFLFGHSMGFAVVEVIAAKYPRLCAGIGAIDGAHFEVPTESAGQEQWRRETQSMAASMTSEKAREDFIQMLFMPDTPVLLKEEVLRTSRTVPLAIGRSMIEGVASDLRYWLPKRVELPCLAIYSPAYQLPPAYRDDFARMYPRVEYHEVQSVSHFFMLEIPYRVNQLIADFVARH